MPIPEAQLSLTLDRVAGCIVQVPLKLGLRVVDELGDRCGAAIADTAEDTVEFFVTDDPVDWPDGVLLPARDWILIPADRRRRPPGRHWARWTPRRERAMSADVLAAVIRVAGGQP